MLEIILLFVLAAIFPATIVYSYVGGMLTGGAQLLVNGLLILFALFGIVIILRQVYAEAQKKKAEK